MAPSKLNRKNVIWIPKAERIIPLTHYLYHSSRFPKKSKDLGNNNIIINKSNKLVELVSSKGVFYEIELYKQCEMLRKANEKIKNNYTNRKVVVNNLLKTLNKEETITSIILYIFSRKQCEEYAHSVEIMF